MNDAQLIPSESGYSLVNGLKMYYEIYRPKNSAASKAAAPEALEGPATEALEVVLIHGGGSTIQTSFGHIIPYLARNRTIIAMDLQAHGRTADRSTPLSFQQDADDVSMLLKNLEIAKADILGFSNGGQTAIEFGIRHGEQANKLIICSALYNRSGAPSKFWDGFKEARLEMMPEPLQTGFLEVNNSKTALQTMFDRDVERMKNFKGWTDDEIRSIKNNTLVINTTNDVSTVDHAVSLYRLIPNADLVIVPGYHGEYLDAIRYENGQWRHTYAAELIEEFLRK